MPDRGPTPRSKLSLTLVTVVVSVTIALTSCRAILPTEYDGNYPELNDPVPVEDYEPSEDEINRMMPWDCFYDPTMNENWHDDVICRRGTESFRPLLLEDQFVTADDMTAAGEAYEAELNASSTGGATGTADACRDGKDDWRDILYDCEPPG